METKDVQGQDDCDLIGIVKTSDIIALILGERDKKVYIKGLTKDEPFFNIVAKIVAYEHKHNPTFFHLQLLPGEGDKHEDIYVLWNRLDWDHDVEKQRVSKLSAERRLEAHANDTELYDTLRRGVAEQFGMSIDEDIVKSTAGIVRHTKNRVMAAMYGVSEELMNKTWGIKP